MIRDPFTSATAADPNEDDDVGDPEDPRETMRAMRPHLDIDWPYPSHVPQQRRSASARAALVLSIVGLVAGLVALVYALA